MNAVPILKYFSFTMSEKEICDAYITYIFDEDLPMDDKIKMDKECTYLLRLMDDIMFL